jgi:hypothetical protein
VGPLPTRRQFLAGLGCAVGLGAVAATLSHAYTGPVTLVIDNDVREPLTVDVRVARDSSLVHRAAYEMPAFTPTDDPDTPGTGRVEDRIVDRAVHGTVYTVEASTDVHDGLPPGEDGTYRVTCTGYTDRSRPDGSEKRLTDRISLAIHLETGAGISLDGPSCGGAWG